VNILLVVLVPLTLVCVLFAPWLVRTVVAPALAESIQVRTVVLMRVMLFSTAIFGVSGIVMGTLNAHQHFLLPAIAPIFYNLALIGGAVLGGVTGIGAMGPAIGMVIGALAHLLVQVPGLLRYRARYTPLLGLDDQGVREVGLLMAPRVLGMAALQLNMVITNNLASHLGTGAISALEYAYRLMLLPQGVFAQAVGTVAFPTFAAQVARGQLDELRQTLTTTLCTLIAITLPASTGLIMLGQPLIALLFQGGEFDQASTRSVAWALSLFALGLVAHSAIEVLARAFYALYDTWTPAGAAVLSMVLNVLLGLSLPPLFTRSPAHGGLALANALAVLAEMYVLLVLIHRRIGGLDSRRILILSVRALLASVGMSVALFLWLRVAPASTLVQSVIGLGLGVVVYGGLAFLLRIDELQQMVKVVLRRNA